MKHRILLSVAALAILGACTPTMTEHGNILQDEQIAQVKPGQHLRSDVLRILGSPTSQSPFDANLWYYTGRQKQKRGVMDAQVIDERVVTVKFNDQGIVTAVNELENESIDIPFSSDATRSYGNEQTMLQEFLGNLGKFNPQSTSSDGP